jgi:hypothetical protein
MAFADDQEAALQQLKAKFPSAPTHRWWTCTSKTTFYFLYATVSACTGKTASEGTEFQLKVWENASQDSNGKIVNLWSYCKANAGTQCFQGSRHGRR